MQSAAPGVIGSDEVVPPGAIAASFPLDFFFLLESAAPGAAGSAEAAAPWAFGCFFRVGIFAGWTNFACFRASRTVSDMKMDSDSGEGVMNGFLMCSSDILGGIAGLVEPSLDSAFATSLFALGS